jgi:hypothetical protein
MKHIATVALMLNVGVAGIYAQPLNMTLSGTSAPSTINLGTGTPTSEYNLDGYGTLGLFTLRTVSASAASQQQSSTCSGLYFPVLAGEGVFRFQDGSLLKVNLTGGSDCIDLAVGQAHCTRIFQVTGGTGRFKNASGNDVTLTMTVAPVVPGKFVFFTVTGAITGTISGVATEEDRQDERR